MSGKELVKHLFLTRKCASCRQILSFDEFDRALCSECETAYRVATTEGCPNCLRSAIECTCQPKMLSSSGSLCLRKLFFYHSDKALEPQNKLIYFIKRTPSKRAFEFLADELWGVITGELKSICPEGSYDDVIVTAVPRGRKARMLYGFDQSEEMCRVISKSYGVGYVSLLKRKHGGKEQKKLNAAERRKNIKGLMSANKRTVDLAQGKYVVLLDDIVTTGASMSACIPILRKMGVKGVICATLALDVKKKSNM